jgi:16S rRNA (guanine966-N2)-methyltransferase
MVRVIAGIYKKRILKTLEGQATRPTGDRLKETLFNLLRSRIQGSRFLDCFAGSGSIGIEALSQGAASVAFIENSRRACQIIDENLRQLRLSESPHCRVLGRPVEAGLKILHQKQEKFDIVFMDPPYLEIELYPKVIKQLVDYQLLNPAAVIIAEHSKRYAIEAIPAALDRIRDVRQGESVLSLFQLK